MPLPKVNTPTYELVLPSNNKKIKYRPFLVREEKILIMALESEDMKQITNSVVEILNACILTKGIRINTLSTFESSEFIHSKKWSNLCFVFSSVFSIKFRILSLNILLLI